eukprot:13300380-Alexandrium_andersonii.AAC.1
MATRGTEAHGQWKRLYEFIDRQVYKYLSCVARLRCMYVAVLRASSKLGSDPLHRAHLKQRCTVHAMCQRADGPALQFEDLRRCQWVIAEGVMHASVYVRVRDFLHKYQWATTDEL